MHAPRRRRPMLTRSAAAAAVALALLTLPFATAASARAEAPAAAAGKASEVRRLSFISLRELPPALRHSIAQALDPRDPARARVAEDTPGWPVDAAALKAGPTTIGRFEITPCDLTGSGFAAMRWLGWHFDDARAGEAVVWLERHFARDDGARVVLREWNYAYGNAAVIVLRERVNARVGAHPAVLSIDTAPSGRVRSTLTWQDASTDYRITVLDDVDHPADRARRFDREWLLGLARSLGS
jgi:hypothetical protein